MPIRRGSAGRRTSTRVENRSASSSAKRLHPERLGRVVAGGDEVDAGLARGHHRRLGRLTRDVAVVSLGGRLREEAGGAAGADGDAADRRRGRRRERAAYGPAAARCGTPARRSRRAWATAAAEPDVGEAFERFDAERTAEQGVVADLGVGVEREVVGGKVEVGSEQRLEPAPHHACRRRGGRGPRRARGARRAARRPLAAARSKSSRDAETPQAIFVTVSAPTTCRPSGQWSG